MSTFNARGIVLKEIIMGESNKFLVLLLKERGKICVSARGAKKPSSKFLSSAQLFAYSDFVIYAGDNFFSLAQSDLIENFYNIRSEYDKLCCGTYLLELTEKIIMEGMNCDEILLLLLKSLKILDKDSLSPGQVKMIFDLKFLQLSGYMPEIHNCTICNKPIKDIPQFFFGESGVVCGGCKASYEKLALVSETALYAMNYVLNQNIHSLFNFKTTDKINAEIDYAMKIFMNAHFNIKLKSLELFI